MANFNETDYKNAIAVLNKCYEYIKEQVGDICKNDDFTDIQLLHLGNTDYPSARGGCDFHLCVTNHYCWQAKGKCGDGYTISEDIALNEKMMKYAFNATPQATIDLAVKVATNWEAIKEKLSNSVIAYKNKQTKNRSILSEFQI